MKRNAKNSSVNRSDRTAISLYDSIVAAMVDGQLPADFSLPDNSGEEKVRWMDGARDGVSIYHMGWHEVSNEEKALIEDAVQAASEADRNKADDLFCKLGQIVPAVSVIDELQNYIVERKDVLSAGNLSAYAIHAIMESTDRECVKFGLSLLELFHIEDDEALKAVIRTLGLSDEFSIFVVFIMMQWEKGNDEIFELARKIHGWGRIHAIERLEPETDEIKQWLLREGVHNRVLPAYSALSCWQKSDAADVLQGDLSREDFSGIRDIIEGMLDEGPCSGISEIENAADMITTFLNKVRKMEPMLEDFEVVRIIRIYFKEDNPAIVALCQELLDSEDCRSLVRAAVKEGKALELAQDLQIEYKDDILQLLKTEFEDHHYLCSYLTGDSGYRSEVLQIFEQNLPLDDMKTAPTKSLGLGETYKRQQQLESIVQTLRNYPLEGIELIETALQSAPVRTRNQGLMALQEWVSSKNTPLEKLLPEIHALLCRLREIEVDDGVRERMNQLIEGNAM